MSLELPELLCDVCGEEPAVGVACVPFLPISVAYGSECLKADAHPYGLVVANTALCGGMDEMRLDPGWVDMINHTLHRLGISREQFEADVAENTREMDEALAADENQSHEKLKDVGW